jgi:integration host factor subunit beta
LFHSYRKASFRVRARRPRQGRNPKTGAVVTIPAKRVLWFKPGKDLCARVNARPLIPEAPKRRPTPGQRSRVRQA